MITTAETYNSVAFPYSSPHTKHSCRVGSLLAFCLFIGEELSKAKRLLYPLVTVSDIVRENGGADELSRR